MFLKMRYEYMMHGELNKVLGKTKFDLNFGI